MINQIGFNISPARMNIQSVIRQTFVEEMTKKYNSEECQSPIFYEKMKIIERNADFLEGLYVAIFKEEEGEVQEEESVKNPQKRWQEEMCPQPPESREKCRNGFISCNCAVDRGGCWSDIPLREADRRGSRVT